MPHPLMLLCDSIPDLLVPVLQDMMLMSLSCMELQLDQWLLTKGRSSAGRSHSVFCRRSNFLNPQQPGGNGSGEPDLWNSDLYLQWPHFLGWLVGLGKIQGLREILRTLKK